SFAICLVKRQDACRPSAEIDEDFVAADGRDDVCEQLFHGLWVDRHRLVSGQTTCHQELAGLCPPSSQIDAPPGLNFGERRGRGREPSTRRRAGPSDSPTSPLFFALRERLFF